MGAVAFVFPGQGAQHPGMGRELWGCSRAARAVFLLADRLRPGTSSQCFRGNPEQLRQTENAQPCLFAVEMAAAAALEEGGIRPQAVAGFSLGEMAALTWAGSFCPEDGFRLTVRRGALMQAAAQRHPGGMAAVLKLPEQQVETLCRASPSVHPVNYNCPGQLVVAGEKRALEAFCDTVRAAGGRTVPLPVSGAFHSPYMAETADLFYRELSSYLFHPPKIPVYANATAAPYQPPYATLLAAQMREPVLWHKTILAMAQAGVDTFVEAGPGKTLAGLIQRILPLAKCYGVQDRASLERTLAALKEDT